MDATFEKTWQGFVASIAKIRRRARRHGLPIPAARIRRMLRTSKRRARAYKARELRPILAKLARREYPSKTEYMRAVMEAEAKWHRINSTHAKIEALAAVSKAIAQAITKDGRAALRLQFRRSRMADTAVKSFLRSYAGLEVETTPRHPMPPQTRQRMARGIDHGARTVGAGQRVGSRLDRPQQGKGPGAWTAGTNRPVEPATTHLTLADVRKSAQSITFIPDDGGQPITLGPVDSIEAVYQHDVQLTPAQVAACMGPWAVHTTVKIKTIDWCFFDRLWTAPTILQNPS